MRCLGCNVRWGGVEIDLVFQAPSREIWLIEVKSLSSVDYFERRLKPEQVARIRRVLRGLLEAGRPARAHLALVSRGRIRWVADFFVRDL